MLTNAQILALPTTPVLVIPAMPGAICSPVMATAHKVLANVYTNIGASAATGLLLAYTNTIPPSGSFGLFNLDEINWGFFGTATTESFLLPTGCNDDGNGGVFPPGGNDFTNTGVYISATNKDGGGSDVGNFTGGNAANTVTVNIAYTVVTVP